MNRKVYISGPLTAIPDLEGLKRFYESLADVCSGLGMEPYVPHTRSDPILNRDLSPAEVYRMDRDQVEAAGLVIAYVGAPSLGVGMELEIAHQCGIPVLLLVEAGAAISRMARGSPAVVAELRFQDRDEALLQVAGWLQELVKEHAHD